MIPEVSPEAYRRKEEEEAESGPGGLSQIAYPRCSMYEIFTYVWVIFRANIGKYSIHGAYGYPKMSTNEI